MIVVHEDDWVVFFNDDCVTEIWRVKPPPGGFTMAELEALTDHLKKLARAAEHGPS